MSACWEQQMVSLVEYTCDVRRRKLLDACEEYRATLDEANRRIDDLRDQLLAKERELDDAKGENAGLFARQTLLVSEVESLRKQRNEAEMECNCLRRRLEKAHTKQTNPWVTCDIQRPPADVDLEVLVDGYDGRPRLARYVPSLFLSGWLLRDTPPGPAKFFITFEGSRWRYPEQPVVPPAQPLS